VVRGKNRSLVPKAKAVDSKNIKPNYDFGQLKKKNHIVFSFENLDFSHEYFGLDGTCENWSKNLFEKIKEISCMDNVELSQSGGTTYRFHNHQSEKAEFEPPEHISRDDFYQIRLGTSKGGIHGVLYENTFYVFWLDPHHNMYPDDRYGGLKKIKPPSTCCKERDDELKVLSDKNLELKKENEAFEKLFAEMAK